MPEKPKYKYRLIYHGSFKETTMGEFMTKKWQIKFAKI